jgi:hypothetical protein
MSAQSEVIDPHHSPFISKVAIKLPTPTMCFVEIYISLLKPILAFCLLPEFPYTLNS